MKTEERTDFLDRDQLRLYFEQGCKPHSEWGIGSEYENFIFDKDLIEVSIILLSSSFSFLEPMISNPI